MTVEPIELWVYDMSQGLASVYGPALLGQPVEGVWHTSLVLYGMEISYGHGISATTPGTTHHGTPTKRFSVGTTHLPKSTLLTHLSHLGSTYTPSSYHLLTHNCTTFTSSLLHYLNGQTLPPSLLNHATELASTPFGKSVRPIVEEMFVGADRWSAEDAVKLLHTLGLSLPDSPALGENNNKPQSRLAVRLRLIMFRFRLWQYERNMGRQRWTTSRDGGGGRT
ncbi:hypothetical protein JCM11641_003382 [Rhodosporidiobolus odoratus]